MNLVAAIPVFATILRDEWALNTLWCLIAGSNRLFTTHKVSSDAVHAASKAVLAGTDVECLGKLSV